MIVGNNTGNFKYQEAAPGVHPKDLELAEDDNDEPQGGVGTYAGMPIHCVPPEIRQDFARKVFCVVGLQLLLTAAVAAPLVLIEPLHAVLENPATLFVCFIGSMACLCALTCNKDVARTYPKNMLILGAFTTLEGVLVAMCVAQYELGSVLLAIVVTALAVLAATTYAIFAKKDYTSWGMFGMGGLVYFLLSGMVLMFFPYTPILTKAYALVGSLLFIGFLIFDVQRIVGGEHRSHEFSIDDYVLAAVNVYLDVINIFLYVLSFLGDRRQ